MNKSADSRPAAHAITQDVPGSTGADIAWYEWKHMNGREIAAVDRSRAVVLVTFSPLEVHGPHLPTITDNIEGDALLRRTAEKLAAQHPEIVFLHLPPIFVASDVLPHVGSISFTPKTLRAVVGDLGRSLAKQGFKKVWIGNFHGGPRHFVPIETACAKVNRRWGGEMISVFSLMINRLTGGGTDVSELLAHHDGISKEDLVGDSHGGALETSLLLHLIGEHVAPDYQDIERMTVDIKLERDGERPLNQHEGRPGLRELFRSFKHKLRYYEEVTYSGHPAAGTADLGDKFLDTFADLSAEALSELWRGEIGPADCRSPLWKARFVFNSALVSRLFEAVMGHESPVF